MFRTLAGLIATALCLCAPLAGAYIRSEIAKWGKVIKESGAKVE